ncbi:ComF family protein [Tropicimonas aquimaris]|uniref:ComF family protein n=1 Tax=Tropicimonas aquimaris TaxID=914152 RepID=A0ABW3IVZ9_9RHOB
MGDFVSCLSVGAAMRGALRTTLRTIYPPHCLSCNEVVGTERGLCGACWAEAVFINGLVCELCGVPLAGEEGGGPACCDDCLAIARPWTAGRAALVYAGTGRRLVLGLKHGDRTELAKVAAGWMAHAGRDILEPDLLVAPVPLHWWRLFRRRYNQSALLSVALGRLTGLECCPDLLVRTRATPTQEGRDRHQRFRNVSGAIAVHPRRADGIAGRRVLLVDDVLTSGATMAACADVALAAGACEVRVLALARVSKDR